MFLTIVLGVIVAVVILGVIGAIAQDNPGCAGWIIIGILLFALARCVF